MAERLRLVCMATMVILMVLVLSNPSLPTYVRDVDDDRLSFCKVTQNQGADVEFWNSMISIREPRIPPEPPVPSEPQMPRIPEVQTINQQLY